MGLNISPATVQRLRNLQQSEKFQTFSPETQQRVNELSMQFDDEGNKKFITREDRFLENPSLTSLAKTGLLQVPILGSSLSAKTERNVNPFGIAGTIQSGMANVQKNIAERPPVEIREPAGPVTPITQLTTGARALGANLLDSASTIVPSFMEGASAPRGAVQSPLGVEAMKERDISEFMSPEDLQDLQEGKGLPILKATFKSTANDLAGLINDAALDAGMNAMWFGTVPAMRAGAVRFMHLPIGQQLAKAVKVVDAIAKTEGPLTKGYAQRFVWEMNNSMRNMVAQSLKSGLTRAAQKGTVVGIDPKYKGFLSDIFPEYASIDGVPIQIGMGGASAGQLPSPMDVAPQAPLQGPIQSLQAASQPVGGKLPPFDEVAASQAIAAMANEPPVGAGTAAPLGTPAAPVGKTVKKPMMKPVPPDLGISQETFNKFVDIMQDVPPELVEMVHRASKKLNEPLNKTLDTLIDIAKKDLADPNYSKSTPKEELPQIIKELESIKKANELVTQETEGASKDLLTQMKSDIAEIAKDSGKSVGQVINDLIAKGKSDLTKVPDGLKPGVQKILNNLKQINKDLLTGKLAEQDQLKSKIADMEKEKIIPQFKKGIKINAKKRGTSFEQEVARAKQAAIKKYGADSVKAKKISELLDRAVAELQAEQKTPLEEGMQKSKPMAVPDDIMDLPQAFDDLGAMDLDELKGTLKALQDSKAPSGMIDAVKKLIAEKSKPMTPLEEGMQKSMEHAKNILKDLSPEDLQDLKKGPTSPAMKKAIDAELASRKNRPLTKDEIEKAKGFVEDWFKTFKQDLSKSAKANKRSVKQEIEALKKDLQGQIKKGEIDAFQANVARRMLLKLEELEGLIAKREGKKLPIPKKSKPKTSTSKDTIIKGDKPFKFSDMAGEKIPPDEPGVVSDPKVMKSAAGYYVGTDFTHPDGFVEPNTRDSGYFKTKEAAEKHLKEAFGVPAEQPKISKSDLIRRAKNVLGRFNKLPDALKNKNKFIGETLQTLLDKGITDKADALDIIDTQLKHVNALEAKAKKPFTFEGLTAEEAAKAEEVGKTIEEIKKQLPKTTPETDDLLQIGADFDSAASDLKALNDAELAKFIELMKKTKNPEAINAALKEQARRKKVPTALEEGIKKPKKKFSLADQTEVPAEGSGKFTVTKDGKPVGSPLATLQGAQSQANALNKLTPADTKYEARELTKEELASKQQQVKKQKVKKKKAVKAKKEKVPKKAEKTPLEEGIEKTVAPPSKTPVSLSPKDADKLLGKEVIKGKKVTQGVVDAVKNFLKAERKSKMLTKMLEGGKTLETEAKRKAMQNSQLALEDLRDTIKEEMGVKSDNFAIKVINKILNYLRDLQPGLSIFDVGKNKKPIDVGPFFKKMSKMISKKTRALRMKKFKVAREKAFSLILKENIKDIVKSAKDMGISVEEFILANKSAFPNAPRSLASLQNALRRTFVDVPVDVKNLSKNDIVQFKPAITTAGKKAGDVGVVEEVGKTIKVRFKNGIAEYTPEEAAKFLRESGSVLKLKDLPRRKLPKVVADILAKNPKHQQLAEVANAAIEAALKDPKNPILQLEATQLTQKLVQALTEKVIDVNDIASIARDHGLTSGEIMRELVVSLRTKSTEAGETLNILSQLQKKLKRILSPEELSQLFPEGEPVKLTPNKRFMYRVGNHINKTANLFKGFLTSQFKTAARNAFVQGSVALGEYINQLAITAYQKISGTGIRGKEFAGVEAYNEAVQGALHDIVSFVSNLRKLKLGRDKERALLKLLNEFTLDRKNLFGQPIHDVVVNKGIVRIINAANILQETMYRTLFVEAELAKFAKQHGTSLQDIKFFRQHADIVSEKVEIALKNTFASNLQNSIFAGDLIKFLRKFPAVGFMVGNPFLRFMFNAYDMIIRKSPIPLTNFLSPEYQRKIQGPNNEEQVKTLVNALQGTLFLAAAMALRSDKLAGPKFYQIDVTPWDKTDDKFWDTRPFAPIPQYLFAVELAKNMMGNKEQTTLTSTDMIQAVVSISRLAGTGLVGLDMLRAEPFKEKQSPEQSRKRLSRMALSFAGQILSAPTVPLSQFQDIIGAFDPAENTYKSTQTNPLFGPSINNIPWLKRMLPDLQQVGRSKPQQPSRMEGLVEFGTGFRIQRVTEFEQVLARHGLSGVRPGTGDPALDQRIIGEMNSEEAQKVFRTLINDPLFKNETDRKVKRDMLAQWMSTAFKEAKEGLMALDQESSEFLIERKIERKMTAFNKKFADKLMDMTLKLLEKRKDTTFSRGKQKVLSQPNLK